MRDILTEASPFDINKDGHILYNREFSHPELFSPSLAHKENPEKMRDLTTAAEDLGESSIKVILESESWRFISTKAKFGLYNTSGKARDYTL